MSQIDDTFQQLRSQGRKAFIPFLTAGDPDVQFTAAAMKELAAAGASLVEVGVPYSDPIADGPVIQASYTRALDNGVRLRDVFDLASQTTPTLGIPVVTMVSYAIVLRQGLENYVARAKEAGVAGAIVPDLLVEESGPLVDVCRKADFSLIQLVTPTTPRDRAVRIAEMSSGFLYFVSVTGITGERTELPPNIIDNVAWLREQTDLPICIGFGVSQPEQAKLLGGAADGVIVGSALVRRIAGVGERSREEVLKDIRQFASSLVGAMQ